MTICSPPAEQKDAAPNVETPAVSAVACIPPPHRDTGRSSAFHASAAAIYADAIACYWMVEDEHGSFAREAPVDVLDLRPEPTQVWLLVQALQQRMAAITNLKLRFRYLAAVPNLAGLEFLRAYPELKSLMNAGILVPVSWPSIQTRLCLPSPGDRTPWRPTNPLAVLAHGFWSKLPHRLFAVHHGALFDANIDELRRNPISASAMQIWRKVESHKAPSCVDHLVRPYLSHFNSAPLPVPVEALNTIDRIRQVASHGCMILTADRGAMSERDMRLSQVDEVLSRYMAHGTFPLNFPLLSVHCRRIGMITRDMPLHDDWGLHIACSSTADSAAVLQRITVLFARHGLGDIPALVAAMESLVPMAPLNTRLGLLRQADYDPQVFLAACPAILSALEEASDCNREAWNGALERVWQNHLPAAGTHALHRPLARAAMAVGAWPLAKRVLVRGMAAQGECAEDLALLAGCEEMTGSLTLAEQLGARSCALAPHATAPTALLERVRRRLEARDAAWRSCERHNDFPLMLEPLDQSHAPAFLHQYRDPQIGIMSGLPPLHTLADVKGWIAKDQTLHDSHTYAILHTELGFAGCVNLATSAHSAFICFWIGADFQGKRCAAAAAEMARSIARRCGISLVFTAAFHDNVRSIRTLRRAGFKPIPLNLPPENDDRQFFFLDMSAEKRTDPESELIAYYRRKNLSMHFIGLS